MPHASSIAPLILGGLALCLGNVLAPSSAAAQPPSDSLRTEALKDFHGLDLQGKDGPLAKAGLDLLVLYHEYRAFQARDGGTFSPSVARARVADGHVTIDAIAMAEGAQLRTALEAIGLRNAAVAGRVVSGRLPIEQIPTLARVEALRSVILSRAQTQGTLRTPPDDAPTTGKGTSASPAGALPSTAVRGTVPDANGTFPFVLGLLGLLLLTEL